jgi:transposase, IS30 family
MPIAAATTGATTAHAQAYERASRPKPAKLAVNVALRERVQDDLKRRYSPEQIAGRLRRQFPGQPEMWVSTETIYQSLYVQSRGALRRELTRCLRTGRALRQPGRKTGQRKNRIPDMVNISERPPEATDRAVPGHWEGDLLIGKRNATAIATLVERRSGFAMLVGLPDGYKPEQVAPALAGKIQTLPEALRRSLTWDQGPEMRDWKQVRVAADIDVYFCDPHAPWQRGSNESTNGLLRQYFPKGTDFSAVSEAELDTVADELTTDPASSLPSPSRPSRSQTYCCNDRSNPPTGYRDAGTIATTTHFIGQTRVACRFRRCHRRTRRPAQAPEASRSRRRSFRTPVAQLRLERRGLRPIAGVELEMDDRVREVVRHAR